MTFIRNTDRYEGIDYIHMVVRPLKANMCEKNVCVGIIEALPYDFWYTLSQWWAAWATPRGNFECKFRKTLNLKVLTIAAL